MSWDREDAQTSWVDNGDVKWGALGTALVSSVILVVNDVVVTWITAGMELMSQLINWGLSGFFSDIASMYQALAESASDIWVASAESIPSLGPLTWLFGTVLIALSFMTLIWVFNFALEVIEVA